MKVDIWVVWQIIYSIVTPLGVLLIPKWMLTCRIQKSINSNLGFGSAMLNLIPFYNSYRIKKEINGTAKFYAFLTIYALVTTLILIPTRTIFITYAATQILVTMFVLLFLLVAFVGELVLMIYLNGMFDAKMLNFVAFVPFLNSALLVSRVYPYFRKHQDTINGTFLDV